MKIGVVGMGLIGGSLAKAIKEKTEHEVYGFDISKEVMARAILLEAMDGALDDAMLPQCEMLIIALYPEAALNYLRTHASLIKKNAIVVDTCGVKGYVCDEAWALADEYGFRFIGGHPMAGLAKIGFGHATSEMFFGASMIICPRKDIDIETMKTFKDVFDAIGFGHYEIATPEKHDRIIAYTSQLAHVLSNAYIKSETAKDHYGYSAGSFRDMTRVAYLNENMWTELFFENKDFLANEIEGLAERLLQYSKALKENDEEGMKSLLREGRLAKMDVEERSRRN